MAVQHLARGERAPSHRRPPLGTSRRQLDLAKNDVDHPVEKPLLVRDVVVERHRPDPELLSELAHRQRLDPLAPGQGNRRLEHALPVERRARRRVCLPFAHRPKSAASRTVTRTPYHYRTRTPY